MVFSAIGEVTLKKILNSKSACTGGNRSTDLPPPPIQQRLELVVGHLGERRVGVHLDLTAILSDMKPRTLRFLPCSSQSTQWRPSFGSVQSRWVMELLFLRRWGGAARKLLLYLAGYMHPRVRTSNNPLRGPAPSYPGPVDTPPPKLWEVRRFVCCFHAG